MLTPLEVLSSWNKEPQVLPNILLFQPGGQAELALKSYGQESE